jgi:hypothetical protein
MSDVLTRAHVYGIVAYVRGYLLLIFSPFSKYRCLADCIVFILKFGYLLIVRKYGQMFVNGKVSL